MAIEIEIILKPSILILIGLPRDTATALRCKKLIVVIK